MHFDKMSMLPKESLLYHIEAPKTYSTIKLHNKQLLF